MGPKSAKLNALILLGPVFFGLLIAMNFQIQLAIVFFVGFGLFIRAKISVIKNGKLASFGPKEMTTRMKKYYYIGYATMILSAVLCVLLSYSGRGIF